MPEYDVYESLLDVPLDEYDPEEDGDDSIVPVMATHDAPISATRQLPERLVLVVPYRPSRPGSKGLHVRALNRALSKAGFRRWTLFSTRWNRWVTKSLKRFQASKGLPQTGVYDRKTHERLARFYDAYAIKYLLIDPKAEKDAKERAGFIAQLMYLYNRRWGIAYSQRRPFDLRRPPRALDCSSSGEWGAKESGLRSLSGYPSFGYGNTWSQLDRYRSLRRLREGIVSAKAGDPLYYGRSIYSPTHVAFFLGKSNGVYRVFSFGSYPAKILAHDYRHDRVALCNLTGR